MLTDCGPANTENTLCNGESPALHDTPKYLEHPNIKISDLSNWIGPARFHSLGNLKLRVSKGVFYRI
ncbi:hypothetical protein EMIT0194P_100132 [Pseudomonas serbica]